MSKVYTKNVEYIFEVRGEELAIINFHDNLVEVEECRKNGSEDCHMCGCLILVDGKWQWESENFSAIEDEKFADEIRDFIQENGLPEEIKPIIAS